MEDDGGEKKPGSDKDGPADAGGAVPSPRWRRWGRVTDVSQDLRDLTRHGVREVAREHLVENHAEAVNIAGRANHAPQATCLLG